MAKLSPIKSRKIEYQMIQTHIHSKFILSTGRKFGCYYNNQITFPFSEVTTKDWSTLWSNSRKLLENIKTYMLDLNKN